MQSSIDKMVKFVGGRIDLPDQNANTRVWIHRKCMRLIYAKIHESEIMTYEDNIFKINYHIQDKVMSRSNLNKNFKSFNF